MRAQPTLVTGGASPLLQFDWDSVSNLSFFTSPTISTSKSSTREIAINGAVSGGTQGQTGAVMLLTGGYIGFNAEL
jgi:hypothetical protein